MGRTGGGKVTINNVLNEDKADMKFFKDLTSKIEPMDSLLNSLGMNIMNSCTKSESKMQSGLARFEKRFTSSSETNADIERLYDFIKHGVILKEELKLYISDYHRTFDEQLKKEKSQMWSIYRNRLCRWVISSLINNLYFNTP